MDLAYRLWTAKKDTDPNMPSWESLLLSFTADQKLTPKIRFKGKELIEDLELYARFVHNIPVDGCTLKDFKKLKTEFCNEFCVNAENLDLLLSSSRQLQPPEQPSTVPYCAQYEAKIVTLSCYFFTNGF